MPKWLCALTSEGGGKNGSGCCWGGGRCSACWCLLPFGEQKTAPQPTTSQSQDSFEEQYRLSLQTQVEELLGQMAGVGQVKVYLTLSSTQQTQYQSDSSRQTEHAI